MKRIMLMTALILAGSLPGGLAPGIWILRATADELPVPPIPPADRPPADIAPVPNVSAQAPVAPASEEPSVDVKLYRAKPYDPGLGFTPGSRYQTNEDRKPIQTPGLSISVPLK